jgi:hypothetical protein
VADRKISDFQQLSALASGYLVPIVDLTESALIDQNKTASIAVFDNRYLTVSGATISGQLLVSSGTAAAPGLGVGQANTGLFNPIGDSLGVTTGGQEAGRFNGKGLTLVNSVYASGVVASGGSVSYVGVGVGRTDTGFFASNGSFVGTALSGVETSRATQSGTYFRNTVFVASGALNKPGVAVGDADTGLVLVDANVLGVAAAGLEIARFDPSGVTTFAGSGAIDLPVGSTAQRPVPSAGMLRFNSEQTRFEGYNGNAWTSVGGGATGSGTDEVFILNQTVVSGSYTIPDGYNAMSTGPVIVSSGVTVTVNSGSVWAII